MSSNPHTNLHTTSELLLPRDSSSVGSGNNETSDVVVIYNPTPTRTPDDGPVRSKRRRTEDTSLPPQLLGDLQSLVDDIAKEMKDLRKCELAILHYEEYLKGNSFPKDIDIQVKFGNPYPRAVSKHSSTSLESLAQKEKLIWDKAKAEIVALRLETLKETQQQNEYVIREMRDPSYFETKFEIPPSTTIEVTRQAFENMASLKITEMENLFKEQTKAFEARQQKRLKKLQKQQEKADAMDIDDNPSPDDSNAIIKSLKEEISALHKQFSSLAKELSGMKSSHQAQKNSNAPERNGHGNPVLRQTRGDNFPPRQRRPNQNNQTRSYKDALNRPSQRSPQPRQQHRDQERGNDQDGQWTTVHRKRANKTLKKKQGQNPKMNQKSEKKQNQSANTTGNGNREKR